MTALTLMKQSSLKALESVTSMLSMGSSAKLPPPPPRLTVVTALDSDVLLEAHFSGSRLGLKLVLAVTEGRTAVIVEEVVAGFGPEGLCPRDVLVAVDGGKITVPRPDAFDAWIAKLRKRPRPLVLTFAPGAGRAAAAQKQWQRDQRLRSKAALKAYEAKDDDGEAAYNAAMLTANGVGGPKDPIAAIQLLRKAAFLDVVKAQVALGHLYRQGSSSVTKNDDEAFRWYEKAALISAVRKGRANTTRPRGALSTRQVPPRRHAVTYSGPYQSPRVLRGRGGDRRPRRVCRGARGNGAGLGPRQRGPVS